MQYFSSAAAGYGLAENKLFDLWHIDGLDDGDYVTAQIVGGDLTAANLSVWGEIDGFMTDAHNSDKLSWPYLNRRYRYRYIQCSWRSCIR